MERKAFDKVCALNSKLFTKRLFPWDSTRVLQFHTGGDKLLNQIKKPIKAKNYSELERMMVEQIEISKQKIKEAEPKNKHGMWPWTEHEKIAKCFYNLAIIAEKMKKYN